MSRSKDTKVRDHVFVINNWTEEELVNCLNVIDKAKYSIIGFEGKEKGTPHIQGYVYFHHAILSKTLEKRLGRCWTEPAKGTAQENQAYCSKEGEFNEFGEIPSQGERTDLLEFKKAVMDGVNEETLIDNYPTIMARYDRFYNKIKCLKTKKIAYSQTEALDVTIIIGYPDAGKTRQIYDNHKLEDIYRLELGDGSKDSIFWNDYQGEEVILIDDFHCNIKLDYMLRLLDRYPQRLNTKGGYTYRNAKKIYITSNLPLECWYMGVSSDLREAFMRRITKVITMQRPV